jgi:hypothetical protein
MQKLMFRIFEVVLLSLLAYLLNSYGLTIMFGATLGLLWAYQDVTDEHN